MTKLPVGLQLYSVRDALEKDFEGTIKAVAEMGYDQVEFAGIYKHSAEEVKRICAEAGVTPISAHVGMNVILPDVAGVVKTYAEIGCKYMVIPWMDAKFLPGGENYAEFLENIKIVAAELHKYGMTLCYHNHDFEFEKVDGKNKLDILYAETDPANLQTQIDTCWANVGGENPSELVKKYTGRAPLVHIKDFVGSKSANMYGLIDGGKVDEKVEKPKVVEQKVTIQRDVFFTINSAKLRASEQVKIDELVTFLNAHPTTKIVITGYAARPTGNTNYNMEISQKRAQAVAAAIISTGISSDRVTVEARGDLEQPFAEQELNRVAICIAEK